MQRHARQARRVILLVLLRDLATNTAAGSSAPGIALVSRFTPGPAGRPSLRTQKPFGQRDGTTVDARKITHEIRSRESARGGLRRLATATIRLLHVRKTGHVCVCALRERVSSRKNLQWQRLHQGVKDKATKHAQTAFLPPGTLQCDTTLSGNIKKILMLILLSKCLLYFRT